MTIVALHGVPLGPSTWDRVRDHWPPGTTFETPAFRGIATDRERDGWDLDGFADEILPLLDADTVVVGHDLGGVVAAMAALRTPVRAVVLTGTALEPAYWRLVRMTALPGVAGPFYRWFSGRMFLAAGVAGVERASFVSAAERELSTIPDLPGRMRRLAAEMRPPPDLATSLGAATHVHLVWGRRDRAYPPLVARRLAATVGAQPAWIDAGHYAMWEAPDAFARAVLHAVG